MVNSIFYHTVSRLFIYFNKTVKTSKKIINKNKVQINKIQSCYIYLFLTVVPNIYAAPNNISQ